MVRGNGVDEIEKYSETTKFMICIFWNFYDLLYIYILDKGERYNSKLVIDVLVAELEQVGLKHRPVMD